MQIALPTYKLMVGNKLNIKQGHMNFELLTFNVPCSAFLSLFELEEILFADFFFALT